MLVFNPTSTPWFETIYWYFVARPFWNIFSVEKGNGDTVGLFALWQERINREWEVIKSPFCSCPTPNLLFDSQM